MTPPKPVKRALEVRGIVLRGEKWHSLRGGRTNSVWRIETTAGALVCKLFDLSGKNPLYPNLPDAEFETLTALLGQNIAPAPVAHLNIKIGEVLVYRFIKGQNWRSGVQDVAALLAKIHALPLTLSLRPVASGSNALALQTRRILEQCQNAMNAVPHSIFDPEIAPVARPVLIHTDVVPNNLIATPQGLRLIDWQCPGLGDPCEDIASFLSPSMQHLYGAAPLSPDQIEAFFLAYDQPAIVARYRRLAALFHWRAAAYCLWKSERGCADYSAALALELSALQEPRRHYNEAGQNDADADIA